MSGVVVQFRPQEHVTRRECVIELLRDVREIRDGLDRTAGYVSGGELGHRIHASSPLRFAGPFRELERVLSEMRETRPKQYAHVRARYVDCERVQRKLKGRKVGRDKWAWHGLGAYEAVRGEPANDKIQGETFVIVERWPEWVRGHVVDLGVDWIAARMRGSVYYRPELADPDPERRKRAA